MVLTRSAAELRPGDRFFGPVDTRLRTIDFVARIFDRRPKIHVKSGDRVFTFEVDAPIQVEVDS